MTTPGHAMQLTITDAAKMFRKQRKTLYRHISSGRLSCSVRSDGHKCIEFSEMLRCYGEPPAQPGSADTKLTREAAEADALSRVLLAELVEINRQQAIRLESLEREVAGLREDLRRLPAPQSPAEAPETTKATTLADDDPHGFKSLVASLRTAQDE